MTIYPLLGNSNELLDELRKIGCAEKAVSIFNKKFDTLPIKIIGIKTPMANIIKQEMISCKGDAVVHSETVSCGIEKTDILLLGNQSIYQNFFRNMEFQAYLSLVELGKDLKAMISKYFNKLINQTTRNKKILDYSRPVIMGILNVTKDSFYDGNKYLETDSALKRCEEMVSQGAKIIDIGGESTRPESEPIPIQEELDRVIPLIEKVFKNIDAVISIDTYKSKVAEEALKAGADIINDISALSFDINMASVVKNYQAIVVLMHIKGTPHDMQINPFYEDVIKELVEYFDEKIGSALKYGISENRIILDPGSGFGKRLADNKMILKYLSSFKKYGLPLLIGGSRKSMIGMILSGNENTGQAVPAPERLYGTLAVHAYAFLKGADIFRVHDILEHFELLKTLYAIK